MYTVQHARIQGLRKKGGWGSWAKIRFYKTGNSTAILTNGDIVFVLCIFTRVISDWISAAQKPAIVIKVVVPVP